MEIKQVSRLEVNSDQDYWEYTGWYGALDPEVVTNSPNATILNTYEGQIITAGIPYTLTGYADAYVNKVTAVEISMDNGMTWKTFDVSDTDHMRWIYWEYTFTPELGAYNILVRAISDQGETSYFADHVMVNAED